MIEYVLKNMIVKEINRKGWRGKYENMREELRKEYA